MQYKIISPVNSNNRRFEPGELIDLTDRDAAPLLHVGAIEEARLPYQQPATLNFNINLDK
jgi:hypothetical protein